MNEYRFEDLKVGLEASFSREISLEMLQTFIGISGDNNPLHAQREYALVKGYKDQVVHGMLTASLYSTLVGVYLPGKYCLLQSVDSQFVKPVFPGDKLNVSGKVKQINDTYKQVEIKARVENQDGILVSRAKIKVGVLDE